MHKVLNILGKIAVGLCIFYLVLAWVILPLGLVWGIQSQGTKILKTPVKVRSVSFNPFLWKLNISGLQILDQNKKLLVGLDRFSVDVSFKDLVKKVYRLQTVAINGLTVNTVLESGGSINLMKLAPVSSTPSAEGKPTEASKTDQPAAEQKTELPVVFVDQFILEKGVIHFEDHTISPVFKTTVGDINIIVKNISTRPDDVTDVVFKALVDEKGAIEARAQVKPLKQPLELESTVTIGSYILTVLSPYVGKYTGRGLSDGEFDFQTTYHISNNKLRASHKVLVQKFTFGDKVESKDALNLPYGLALALLEDPQGRINISLPVEGDMSDPEFKYTHLIWQVTRNFFVKLMTKPFAVLGSLLGSESSTDELGVVRFQPGQSQLIDAEQEKLKTLVKGLKERPKLLLEINGSVDPLMDWKAIKTEVFKKDYSALRAESKKDEAWIYEQLFQRRFGIKDLWQLAKQYKRKGAEDIEGLNEEIKRRLIEDASPDKVALDYLAQERAKVIYDFLLKEGMDAERLKIGVTKETQGSFDAVPLEFTLTIRESAEKPEVPSETTTTSTQPAP